MRPHVVLAGGGTAGHVTPALATAAALRDAGTDVTFVGTVTGMEARLVPQAGFPLEIVEARALRGRSLIDRLTVPIAVALSARRTAAMLRRRGAGAAGVFGGYVSGPLALGARLAGVPLVIHEQNAVPGLANRLASRWAVAVAASVPVTVSSFAHPERVEVTGNPVRPDLVADLSGLRDEALTTFGFSADRATLLVFGGSLGAARINDAIVSASWTEPERLQILHVTGRRDAERMADAWRRRVAEQPLVHCTPFVERMDLAYAAADLAVCRAGASTIAELAVVGMPAVLVPYPHAAADEQTANAQAMAGGSAAVVVADAELDGPTLVVTAEPLLHDERRRADMAAGARKLGRPDAAERVAALILRHATPGAADGS